MKRYTLIALLLLAVLPSTARERDKKEFDLPYKHEISVSWGMEPTDETMNSYSYSERFHGGLHNIYNNYMGRCITSGVISADYSYNFKNWLALGAQVNGSVTRHTEMSAITGTVAHQYRNYALAGLATAKFTYVRREYFRIYTSAGLGVRYAGRGEQGDIHNYNNKGFGIAGLIVPMGITVGKRIYGMTEMYLGTECYGARFGIGYRF